MPCALAVTWIQLPLGKQHAATTIADDELDGRADDDDEDTNDDEDTGDDDSTDDDDTDDEEGDNREGQQFVYASVSLAIETPHHSVAQPPLLKCLILTYTLLNVDIGIGTEKIESRKPFVTNFCLSINLYLPFPIGYTMS